MQCLVSRWLGVGDVVVKLSGYGLPHRVHQSHDLVADLDGLAEGGATVVIDYDPEGPRIVYLSI